MLLGELKGCGSPKPKLSRMWRGASAFSLQRREYEADWNDPAYLPAGRMYRSSCTSTNPSKQEYRVGLAGFLNENAYTIIEGRACHSCSSGGRPPTRYRLSFLMSGSRVCHNAIYLCSLSDEKQTSRFWIKTSRDSLISNDITVFPVHAARLRKHSFFIKLPQLTPHQSHTG